MGKSSRPEVCNGAVSLYLIKHCILIRSVLSAYSQFSRWRHLTTTTTILFVFLFIFKFCIPSGVKITIALINMRQEKPEGFWYL